MSEVQLAAVIGSLKAASVNRAVFAAARDLLPAAVSLTEVPLTDVPFFSEDVEAAGDPPAVVALKEAVATADGLVIFTPEYNRSMPAVTKNAVDWLSRPFFAGPIAQKPVGIVAASPGRGDAAGSRGHLTVAVNGAGGAAFEPTLGFSKIYDSLTDGVLTADAARDELRSWLAAFVEHVRHRPVEAAAS